ncbi:DUF4268 domain-containing protein [Litchfieldella rifensis]|uniref:DUF4268 domain-containing protein n=1 Tax=Litchfieldella rifensis TaxID=762643 RepID=A0ABV7LI55_9GAMM
MKELGMLERIDLREAWNREDTDFTRWLARKQNLKMLGDTLNILDLELESEEMPVGPFRADILCKSTQTSDWVLIENQLEKTDHRHLGQLMTYTAGLEAATIVWIAAHFTDEHRAALDWLNHITGEEINFFGLEIELWKINDSVPAAKFNIVSKPNGWSKSVARVARGIDQESPLRTLQRQYWADFQQVVEDFGGSLRNGNRAPRAEPYLKFSIGRSGFRLAAVMRRKEKRVEAELVISKNAESCLASLEHDREAIETELGYDVLWEVHPDKRESLLAIVSPSNFDVENTESWKQQHDWLCERLNALYTVFRPRVQQLNLDDLAATESLATKGDVDNLVAGNAGATT